MALQIEWMAGHFDAMTGHRLVKSHRKNLRPRRPQARVRWPRSEYARKRLETYLAAGAA